LAEGDTPPPDSGVMVGPAPDISPHGRQPPPLRALLALVLAAILAVGCTAPTTGSAVAVRNRSGSEVIVRVGNAQRLVPNMSPRLGAMLGFASRSTTAGTVVLLDAADCSVLGTVDYGEGVTGIQITDEGRVLSYVDDWYDMTDLPLAPPVESCR
jgi:hypothetical protein